MRGPYNGAYLTFRCDGHSIADDPARVSKSPDYRCDVKDCLRPAKAYWYAGDKTKELLERAQQCAALFSYGP